MLKIYESKLICYGILIIAFCITVGQTASKYKIIDNKIFRSVGKLSYPIYLFHFRLVTIFEKYIQRGKEYDVYMWLIKYFVIMFGAYIIAYLLDKYISIPFNRYMKEKFGL